MMISSSVKRKQGLSLLLVALMLASCAGAARGAEGGRPLKLAKFSLEAIRSTTSSGQTGEEIVDEPYQPPFSQAGGHPWGLKATIEFENELEFGAPVPTQEPRDIVVSLPPGLLGNPMAVPRCSFTQAFTLGECPTASQIGVYRLLWLGGKELLGAIADVVPERGQSAQIVLLNDVHIATGATGHLVRNHAGGYSLVVSSNGIPGGIKLARVETTFWGVPADPSHDLMRGLTCASAIFGSKFVCHNDGGKSSGVAPVPFLTYGTDCAAGDEVATARADSWEEPGSVHEQDYVGFTEMSATLPAATDCNLLSFQPAIEVRPDTETADEPVGYDVRLKVPLSEEPLTNGTPPLRNAVVTLPEGVSVNPSAVDGLRACDEFGPQGIDITGPESEEIGPSGELQLAAGHCPEASIVGTAEAVTPLLPTPVQGHVFLARPGCGGAGQAPCTEQDVLDGNLYRLYLELGGTGELADTGVHIKVEGRTEVDPATGQLTSVFEDNPQTPFSELKIRLNGGPRAPLANPAVCGPARTTTDFTPWSAAGTTPPPSSLFVAGTPDATPSSFYDVTGCGAGPPFAPSLVAGTVTPQAGRFSAFTLNLARQDREQYVAGMRIHTPPGLLGMLSSVPLCQEPAASAGTCAADSKIGTVRVASGAGSHPFEIQGNVYLTGPYNGYPFGLSVVVPLSVGPFNLGDVVVRARIRIDQHDSTLAVAPDESGPYAMPQIVFGVPVRLRRLTVDIDRPGFMFNPTNCHVLQVEANVKGAQGATWRTSAPFAAGGCKGLGFRPRFTAFTSAHTSRARGASLDARLSYPAGSFGKDANIARVKVSLPRQLPSRLTTLQKACPAATFEGNPAACPAASVVGIARASTPLLPVGLSGPVYFVSHGGEAFPSLIIVLQGDGVRVDLTGTTFISKKGITSSTFKTVPDVPVRSFELYLPQGRYSALAANGNLCKTRGKLKMPTEFVAQNEKKLRQATNIQVAGCKATAGKRRGK